MNRLRNTLSFFGLLAALMLPVCTAHAEAEYGTKDEAKTITEKAAALIEKSGTATAFETFDKEPNTYKIKDIYVFVFDLAGLTEYHGGNKSLEGKNLITLKDPDGKLMIADIVNACKTTGEGWVDYKWFDNRIGKVMPKSSYVKKTSNNHCVGAGVYVR